MNAEEHQAEADTAEQISALIDTLHATERRLETLTRGEVDSVADRHGRTLLLHGAQEHIRHVEAAKQAAILNALPAHIALLDSLGVIISVNSAWRHFADANALHSPGHAIGENYLAICDDARGTGSSEALQVAHGIRSVLADENNSFSIEYPCDSPSEQRWFLMTVTPLFAGRARGAVVMHVNITERKRAESSLQRQQSELRVLFDLMPAMIWFKDTANGILRVNQRVAQAAGRAVAEIEGRPSSEIYPQDAAKFFADDLEVIQSRAAKLEIIETLQDPDGNQRWVQTDKVPYFDADNNVIGIVVMARDITERKLAEQSLRASERTMAVAQRIAHFGSWEMDLANTGDVDANVLRWSDEMYRIAGYQPQAIEVSNALFFGMVPAEEHAMIKEAVASAIRERSGYSSTHRLVRPDGDVRFVQETGQISFDEASGMPLRIIGTAHDVTDSVRSERALDHAMQRLTQAQRIGNIGDWEFDVASGAISWSAQVYEIFGRDAALGPPENYPAYANMLDPQSRALQEEKVARAFASGETQEFDLQLPQPHGAPVHVHAVAVPELDGAGRPLRLYGTVQNVSARKRAEAAVAAGELRYQSLFENMVEGYAYCKAVFAGEQLRDFIYVEVNGAFTHLTGLNDVVGKQVSDVIPGVLEAQPELFQIYGRVVLTGRPEKCEVFMEALGIWLAITVYSYDDEHFVAVFDNISTRKRAQEALQTSELEQRQLAQQLEIERSRLVAAQRVANIGSWDTNLSTGAVAWSDETHRIFETDPATYCPTHERFLQFVHPDDRVRVNEAFLASANQHHGQEIEHRLLMPDGRIKFVEERWQIFLGGSGKPQRALGTCQDISERKRSELALQESRQRLALATEAAHIGIWDWDVVANTTVWDPQMFALYGVHEHEVVNAHEAWKSGLHPDDRQRVDAEVAIAFASGADLDSEFRIVRPGGELRVIHTHAVVQFDRSASPARMIGVNWDITERIQAQKVLHDSETRFRQMAASISDVFFLREAGSGRMLYISPAYEQIWGRSCASVYANQEAWAEAVHPDDLIATVSAYKGGLATGRAQYEYRIVRPDGAIRWIETRTFPVDDDNGKFVRIAGIAKDVTERQRAGARISYLTRVYAMLSGVNSLIARVRDREELFQGACQVAIEEGGFRNALMCIVDPATDLPTVAASAGMSERFLSAIRGLLSSSETAPNAIVTRAIKLKQTLVSNDSQFDPRVLLGQMHAESGIHSIAVFPLVVADKAVASLTLYANEVEFFHEDELKLLTGLAGDIAFAIDHIAKSERLDYLAFYDALTGLPNRALFLERVAQSLRGQAAAGTTFSMVLIDLERFKHFNDSLGRPAGDALLMRVADGLKRTLVDASLLARVGADQFAMVISEQLGENGLARFVEKRSALLEDSFRLKGEVIRVAAKFGIARFPDDGVDAESLFKRAEVALKLAKSSGERFAYYSSEMNARNAQRLALEEQLRAAVDTNQFVLHCQARVDMISGEIVGAEALIRWRHPDKGLVAPGDFIALAEETGLIVPIGAWVIDTVCSLQAGWLAAGIDIVPIAVNLSAVQFSTGNLRQTVCDALTAHSLEPRHLELELTESAVMKDLEAAAKTLHALRKLGVSLALDDFGTGYSSLSHLKSFPFSAVKIDRSFVTDITSKPEDAAIAAAIIAMAHGLGLTAIAEGVETEGQFNYLRALGCDEMQGYFFSRPVPMNEFESQLRNHDRMTLPAPTPTDERTLLLVDDEQAILSALTRILRRDGYRILTATTGREGLELLALHSVQVIISDQRMQGMSGTEFLNTVKQLYPDTVRIILSGYTDLEVVTDSVNRGAVFKFLTKPWDDKLLLEQVRDAFRRYRPSSVAA